jgi:hypothetical protein
MLMIFYEVQELFSIKSNMKIIETGTFKKCVDICCSFVKAVSSA